MLNFFLQVFSKEGGGLFNLMYFTKILTW